jgi:hypothetical protein
MTNENDLIYNPELLKKYQIIDFHTRLVKYYGHNHFTAIFTIEIKFEDATFWNLMGCGEVSNHYYFDDLVEEFYRNTPFHLESYATWDYDNETIMFHASLSVI